MSTNIAHPLSPELPRKIDAYWQEYIRSHGDDMPEIRDWRWSA